jgi:hypothetical protein
MNYFFRAGIIAFFVFFWLFSFLVSAVLEFVRDKSSQPIVLR